MKFYKHRVWSKKFYEEEAKNIKADFRLGRMDPSKNVARTELK